MDNVAHRIKCTFFFFAHQVHGRHGFIITRQDHPENVCTQDADYLMTAQQGLALVIFTADCLPIIMYDKRCHAIAVVHAGWRGTVAGVVLSAVQKMQEAFDTVASDLEIYFGPSAKACCYEVGADLIPLINQYELKYHASFLINRNGKTYLNVPELNKAQLESIDINTAAIDDQCNVCTMCNHNFWSYRREKFCPQRQITAVVLN